MKGLIFTYLLTYGGAIIGLFRPWYGFLVYVCFGILKPDDLWHWSVPQGGNYSRIVAVGFLIGWALRGFGDWRFGRGTPIIVSMVLYWFVFVIGAAKASHVEVAAPYIELMGKSILPIVVGATMITSIRQLHQLAWVIVLSNGFLAYEFNLDYYNAGFMSAEFKHGGLDNNGVAITLVTAIGLAFYLGVHSEKMWQKAVPFVGAALMAHFVLFSMSRGGMMSMLITLGVCFILTPKKPRDYLFLLIGLAIIVRLAGPEVQKRFFSSFEERIEVADGEKTHADRGGNRLLHWEACWDSIFRHPLGLGPNHWPIIGGPVYGLPSGQAAHSTWLQTAAELGWPGIFCLLGIYGTCLIRLWPLTRERTPVPDPWIRCFARMTISGLIGFLVAAQFVTVHGVELPYYVALLGMGTLKCAMAKRQPDMACYRLNSQRGLFPPRRINQAKWVG